jgi:succinate dehydrogenase/fumarate reductase flavoprotein subunit
MFALIPAKAVVLATGGGSCLYGRTDNPPGTTGDGIALAYNAGAELVDMECISFQFPEGRLEDLFSSPQAPSEELLGIGAAHYFLGGVKIDERARTSLEGLYAAGETAGGLFGAARLGGSALTDAIVFGTIAGREAAAEAKRICYRIEPDPRHVDAERERLKALLSGSGIPVEQAISRLQSTMWRYCGIIKTKEGLLRALEEIERMEASRNDIRVDSAPKLRQALEYLFMLTISRIIATASLLREESRGCFWRIDHPTPDNERWVKNIYWRQEGEHMRHEIRPAIMTLLTSPTLPRIGAGCFEYKKSPADLRLA